MRGPALNCRVGDPDLGGPTTGDAGEAVGSRVEEAPRHRRNHIRAGFSSFPPTRAPGPQVPAPVDR